MQYLFLNIYGFITDFLFMIGIKSVTLIENAKWKNKLIAYLIKSCKVNRPIKIPFNIWIHAWLRYASCDMKRRKNNGFIVIQLGEITTIPGVYNIKWVVMGNIIVLSKVESAQQGDAPEPATGDNLETTNSDPPAR